MALKFWWRGTLTWLRAPPSPDHYRARHVLVTGTHEQTPQVVNTLFGPLGVIRADAWERLPGRFNGAGATLSAAIAALLRAAWISPKRCMKRNVLRGSSGPRLALGMAERFRTPPPWWCAGMKRGLYLVTPDWDDTARLLEVTRAALEGGGRMCAVSPQDGVLCVEA